MARERYLLSDEEDTIHQNQITLDTAAQKRANWWYYHKTQLLVVILVAIGVGSLVYSIVSRPNPDYTVMMMTQYILPQELRTDIEEQLEKYADDRNGDGEVDVMLQHCRFVTDAQSEFDVADLQASFARFAADSSSGDSMLFIYDDESYDYLNNSDMTGFFAPIDGTENEYYLWKDFKALNDMPFNNYQEEGVTEENIQKLLGDLKLSIRAQDGAAFRKEEKIEYRNDSILFYERLRNDEPIEAVAAE